MGETALLDGFWGIVGASIDAQGVSVSMQKQLYIGSTIAQA